MKIIRLTKGIFKSIPGIEHLYRFPKITGGTNSAKYCYSVWLRHLVYAYKNGIVSVPEKVAELGPGDSLGIGIASLISGAKKYFAFDIVKYADIETNLKIFDELVSLFKEKHPIPDEKDFIRLKPLLDDYCFPDHIFPGSYLKKILSEDRLAMIRNSIIAMGASESSDENMIIYKAPWNAYSDTLSNTVDMIISQAVLQHVDDLQGTYRFMKNILKQGGLMSHTIDFKSMGSAEQWYGHWEYTDWEWKIVRGRKKYYINREPHSTHINLLKSNQFKTIYEKKTVSDVMANRKKLAKRFKNSTDEDLSVSSVFIQAVK